MEEVDVQPRRVTQEMIAEAFKRKREIIAAPSRRSRWTSSRLVVWEDGTTTPLLTVFARLRFENYDEKLFSPYWTNKDPDDERVDNVSLMQFGASSQRAKKPNTYGVPAGSPEYFKRYRSANKEKVAEAQRRYRAKQKERVAAVRQTFLRQQSPVPVMMTPTVDMDEMFAKLEALKEKGDD